MVKKRKKETVRNNFISIHVYNSYCFSPASSHRRRKESKHMCWYQFLFLIRVINSRKQSCSLPLLPMGGLSCRLFRCEKPVMSQKLFVPAWLHLPGWSSPGEFWTGQIAEWARSAPPRAFPLTHVMGCTPSPGIHHGHQRLRSPLPLGL